MFEEVRSVLTIFFFLNEEMKLAYRRWDHCRAWYSCVRFFWCSQFNLCHQPGIKQKNCEEFHVISVYNVFSSVQSLSRVRLCDPMNRSTPGLPVQHQLPEFTQTHVHRVSDAIQLSHPLSSPSPPAPKPSQHQSLFQWVNSSNEVAKVLEFQL